MDQKVSKSLQADVYNLSLEVCHYHSKGKQSDIRVLTLRHHEITLKGAKHYASLLFRKNNQIEFAGKLKE